MAHLLHLLLPALIPSWRFFKSIEPSPRVQWATFDALGDGEPDWHEVRARPAHVSLFSMLLRLFWNPRWNEALFLVSCAERIEHGPTPHSVDEIFARIRSGISAEQDTCEPLNFLQFRLVFVRREGRCLVEDVTFVSEARRWSEAVAR